MTRRKKLKEDLWAVAIAAIEAVGSDCEVWPVATAITISRDEVSMVETFTISGLTKRQATAIVYAILTSDE